MDTYELNAEDLAIWQEEMRARAEEAAWLDEHEGEITDKDEDWDDGEDTNTWRAEHGR